MVWALETFTVRRCTIMYLINGVFLIPPAPTDFTWYKKIIYFSWILFKVLIPPQSDWYWTTCKLPNILSALFAKTFKRRNTKWWSVEEALHIVLPDFRQFWANIGLEQISNASLVPDHMVEQIDWSTSSHHFYQHTSKRFSHSWPLQLAPWGFWST